MLKGLLTDTTLKIEDSYSIVALNGGAYIDDYTYNYYDHDMINRLHCIHEPYQGKRS